MDWEGFFTHYRKPGFIPGYEIVNKLGSGVFGEVYKARKESIGKFYAIKFLKVSDEKVSEAIFKELDTLRYFAQLDHPNLVTIEDQGEVMGIPFIVMGYAGDETLKKKLGEGALAIDDARQVFEQVCRGVSALHEKSIIHFDLKPANIFMRGAHARVGDYGLSKLVSESHMTMSIGRGTPYYMAPEMLKRKGDHRSDIYSLGVILYEMLTGDVPFKGDSEWEVLKKHETEPVIVPASVASPFREIIIRAMEKTPEARFHSVDEMLAALTSEVKQTAGKGFGLPPIPPILGGQRRAAGNVPPLPNARPRNRDPESARQVQEVKKAVHDLVKNIKVAGGAAAERAKEMYSQHKARKHHKAGMDSFYADIDDPEAVSAAGGDVATGKEQGGGLGFFGILFWPIKMLFVALAKVVSSIFKLIGFVLRDIVRYTIVVAITIGLAFLIYAAIHGFDL